MGEFYERSTSSGLRLDWKAPYGMAKETFSDIVQLAKKVESSSSDTVGYGLASKPVTDMSEDSLWKAMLYALRKPALRLEMFCRHSKDEMRLDWQTPKSVCI